MKKTSLFFLLLFAASIAFSQSPVGNGGKQINAGTGFSTYGLPLYVGLDYGVHEDITVGFNVSYRSYRESWFGTRYRHSVIGLMGNANYHFDRLLELPSEWNVYAGLSLGYYIFNMDSNYGGQAASGLGIDGQVGARYFFRDNLGVNLEFGGGNAASGGRIGITYILN